ncbi:MAG: 16S rRNA (adenine(1518)-N(6)/adenine(1519)-N(6))-dimethyltransferase RsmA [Solirubrobacteraceae bacterium]
MTRSARQRELGQNFLVDRNILDVIERLAALSSDDVVLEVGGGPGLLSQRLVARAGFVHVLEVDERMRERLSAAVDAADNLELHFADAVAFDFASLVPAPGKVVANLPYGVAATVILKTIDELPTVAQWVVMVQREVGERFAAGPGTAAYGVPSVLAQLACGVKVLRPISRTVFRPVPNVDSVLLGLRRITPAHAAVDPTLSALVHGAFAHRRKALAGSLALVPAFASEAGSGGAVRERARAAVVALGHPADVRAERLAPEEFRQLAALLAR